MQLLLNYAYDAYLQPEGWEEEYAQKRKDFLTQLSKVKERSKADLANRAKRTWQLPMPFSAYTGTFSNEMMGTVNIELVGDEQLEVSIGNMHCIATPYVKENTIRIELVPGSGEVLQYQVKDTKVEAIRVDGMEFKKVK